MYKDKILKALQSAAGEKEINLEVPTNLAHGDYSTNIALKLKISPEEIKEKLEKDKNLKEFVSKIEVVGGFINFFISQESLLENLSNPFQKPDLNGKTIVIDYSSPNIAKRFSVGHLRSTIIGQAIYNLYKFLGYNTIGDNHLGDWGTQFGMIIAKVEKDKINLEKIDVAKLENLYVEFNKETENNPKLRDLAKAYFKKLENGDPETRVIWQKIVDISIKSFDKIYNRLGIKIDNALGESFFESKMGDVISEIKAKGVSQKSEGAEIIELPNLPPAMVTKSDGTTTYFTRDLATIKHRLDTWHPTKIIYEVGVEQSLHFNQVFETAKLLGWLEGGIELKHIPHGHYRFKGKKMSTRKGTAVHLEEILDESVKKAKDLGNKGKTAEMVGIGAIKYFDLMHSPETFIDFNWQKIMNMQGNSGPYLQYTFARTQSVLGKANFKNLDIWHSFDIRNLKFEIDEELILRILIHFPEVIQQSAEKYSPNLLCNYLYELAQKYNASYNKNKIIGSKEENFRLLLTSSVSQVLQTGLNLLGIETPEKM